MRQTKYNNNNTHKLNYLFVGFVSGWLASRPVYLSKTEASMQRWHPLESVESEMHEKNIVER